MPPAPSPPAFAPSPAPSPSTRPRRNKRHWKRDAARAARAAETPDARATRVAKAESARVVNREERARERAANLLLPIPSPPNTVFVGTSASLRSACAALAAFDVFGVDTETKPVFVMGAAPEPPALLQVAGMTTAQAGGDVSGVDVFVFDLLALLPRAGREFSEGFREILASPQKLLLGVGIEEDLTGLARFYGAEVPAFAAPVSGVVDIGRVKGKKGGLSLQRVVARFAGVRLIKAQSTSNWARRPLQLAQIQYAANDARAALMVFAGAGDGFCWEKKDGVRVGEKLVWMCEACGAKALKVTRKKCKVDCSARPKKMGVQGGGNGVDGSVAEAGERSEEGGEDGSEDDLDELSDFADGPSTVEDEEGLIVEGRADRSDDGKRPPKTGRRTDRVKMSKVMLPVYGEEVKVLEKEARAEVVKKKIAFRKLKDAKAVKEAELKKVAASKQGGCSAQQTKVKAKKPRRKKATNTSAQGSRNFVAE